MQKNRKIPILSKELITYLDVIFPEKSAELKDTERELFEIHRIKTDVLIAEMINKKK